MRNIHFANDRWFAGFLDGEGHFGMRKHPDSESYGFLFTLSLRADDIWILQGLQSCFGGHVYYHPLTENSVKNRPGAHPSAQWVVAAKGDILRIIAYLDEYSPLLKIDEYKIWKEAVTIYFRHRPGKGGGPVLPWLLELMGSYRKQLVDRRRYEADPGAIEIAAPPHPQMELLVEMPEEYLND